ncbi:MAG: AMP-binding protein [Candidatus Omnitrophota bacterium]
MIYNLGENFIKSVTRLQQKTAIESRIGDKVYTLSYSELGKRVELVASFMSSLGVKRSDRVSIILENREEWGIIFFALSYIGAVAVPLDPRSSDKDIKNILSDSGARFVFISKEDQRLDEFLRGVEGLALIGIEEIMHLGPSKGLKRAEVSPDDVMVILYTSGTTDLPKGVMLTHKNLCSNVDSLRRRGVFLDRDVILSILPLYHSYALMATLIAPILSGCKVVYVGSDWSERLAEYLREARITVFIGVPQIFHMMHSKLMKKLKDLPPFSRLYIKLVTMLGLGRILLPRIRNAFGRDLRFCVSGGAKLDKSVAGDFLRLGLKILEGYGLTETSPITSVNPLERPRAGSAGLAIPDVKIKIINEDEFGIGEIAIKGPNVMKGYYKHEDKTRMVIKDGWFLSGDLGYIDRDGYLYITGRSKEVIVLSSGKNIYPEEIERHYSKSPCVKEICVMGVIKEKGGAKIEYLHAIVLPDLEFLKERGEIDIRKVIKSSFEILSKDITPYKHIMGFTLTQEPLPRTVLGKMKRYALEKKFLPRILNEGREERDSRPEDKELLESEVATRLISCIKDTIGIEGAIGLEDSIELDLGVDSLGRVELILAIEKCFDIELTEEMVASEIFTVKDIVLKIEEALKVHQRKEEIHHKEKAVLWPEILEQPLAIEFQKKISLDLDWLDYVLTFLVKGIIGLFFRVFYRLRVEGLDKIPRKGPYILCVNHTSFLDGLIVCAGVSFRIELDLFFIAFRRYFTVPIIRDLVRRSRIIPIDATQIIEAMQGSSFILKHNKALCIFPEGERSIDGELKEFKKGIGIIAKELNTALVPVYIKGAFEAWPRARRFPRLYPIKITFGEAVYPDALAQKGTALGVKDEHEAISLAIREEIKKLQDVNL